jgi:hypothetical protein
MLSKPVQLCLVIIMLLSLGGYENVQAQSHGPQYISPLPHSKYNPAGTTIAIRYGDLIEPQSVSSDLFSVAGSHTGSHTGKTVLAVDQQTIIFKPDQPFSLGENVQVDLHPGISSLSGEKISAYSFSFSISKTDPSDPKIISAMQRLMASEFTPPANPVTESHSVITGYVTAPPDFPQIQVTMPASAVGDGYIFASNFIPAAFRGTPNIGSYLLILDDNGQPVYYQKNPETAVATDFKVMSNGLLAYWESGDYHLLDNSYKEVKTIQAGNGYDRIDLHELILLPNGNYMFSVNDPQTVDMSQLVSGGDPNATVIGSIIQELDPDGNVVFQWNSFDYLPITDSDRDLTAKTIDYVHTNALELDNDGNILLSGRHLDEITKIDHSTGDVIWRLGGKANQFTFLAGPGISDVLEFYKQHDIRRLPNGDISLFDDHNDHPPLNSRALEYTLDETNKTATLVWEYRNTPDVFSAYMGSVQRLPNGNFVIGWGGLSNPNVTEVKPDGTKVFELGFDTPYVNYRAFRFPWHGYPTWAPTLVAQPGLHSTRLTFSWNGATEIEKYEVYGGNSPGDMSLIAETPRTGFESSVNLVGIQNDYCYFQVMPIDRQDQTTQYSNMVQNPACTISFLPLISVSGQ